MARASRVGVNRVMAQCVAGSKQEHPFTNQTGTAEQSIRIATPAEQRGDKTVGIWGSVLNHYFKYLELGTAKMFDAFGKARKLGSNGKLPWQGGNYAPTLRPEAKIFYPGLAAQISAAFKAAL